MTNYFDIDLDIEKIDFSFGQASTTFLIINDF